MKTNKLVNCPQCGGFGFTSMPVSADYKITVCRAKTCELCHGAGVIEAPVTNADRIRAMSDEELAGFLWNFNLADVSTDKLGEFGPHMFRHRLKEWLQMPAEEDKHEAD